MDLNKFVYNFSSGEPSKEKHTCPHCQKTYHWRYNLNRHIKANHGGTTQTCPKCEKSFYRKDNLKQQGVSE